MMGVMRILVAALIVLAFSAGSSAARTQQATVGVYPSGTSFTTNGAAPANPGSAVSLAMPIGGTDDAVILVRGAQLVSVDGTLVPDALEGWTAPSGRPRRRTSRSGWKSRSRRVQARRRTTDRLASMPTATPRSSRSP